MYRQAWQTHNRAAFDGPGPLWVVLGDPAAQGVGASSPMRGWVGQTQWRLETRDRHAWTVLNLSVSGARVDVADLWATTGPPWRGQFADDWFHPNDEGYRRWADAMVAAVRPR